MCETHHATCTCCGNRSRFDEKSNRFRKLKQQEEEERLTSIRHYIQSHPVIKGDRISSRITSLKRTRDGISKEQDKMLKEQEALVDDLHSMIDGAEGVGSVSWYDVKHALLDNM